MFENQSVCFKNAVNDAISEINDVFLSTNVFILIVCGFMSEIQLVANLGVCFYPSSMYICRKLFYTTWILVLWSFSSH